MLPRDVWQLGKIAVVGVRRHRVDVHASASSYFIHPGHDLILSNVALAGTLTTTQALSEPW